MADAGWVALGGVAAGVVGKGLWDWWLAAGKVKADREAREEARRDKRAELRDDLQRETVVALQQTLVDYMMAAILLDNHLSGTPRPWDIGSSPSELRDPLRALEMKIALQISRLSDDTLRDLAFRAAEAGFQALRADSDEKADSGKNVTGKIVQQAIDRAGQLLRKLNEV